jgi:hypothetical protein
VYLPLRLLDGLELFKNSPWIKHASVKRVVVELCGHARGLLYLRQTLADEFSNADAEPEYEQLCASLSERLSSVTNGARTSPELIAACLLGLRVLYQDCPSTSLPYTYSYYISQVCVRADVSSMYCSSYVSPNLCYVRCVDCAIFAAFHNSRAF